MVNGGRLEGAAKPHSLWIRLFYFMFALFVVAVDGYSVTEVCAVGVRK